MDYLETKGRIFDIQRFSIHDGTGIRTIVFFKGCRLRCRWCCNPESQEYDVQTMFVSGKPTIIGKDVTVSQVMETVKRDRPYYYRSGGGLTLSGGEVLCQVDFARDILKAAKNAGINTAIESTAYASFSDIEKILPYLDQYLMDIKHINSAKHKEYTGVDNELILENAKKIAKYGKTELIIRVPVIPSFNETSKEVEDITKFVNGLTGVKTLHLLPYHGYGQDKYKGLDRKYLMESISTPENEHMDMLRQVVEKNSSVTCKIGG